ncbi:hypothetical protein ACEPAI_4057 [Sanghuangporus weigelae]
MVKLSCTPRASEFQIAAPSSLAGCQSKLRARGGVVEQSIVLAVRLQNELGKHTASILIVRSSASGIWILCSTRPTCPMLLGLTTESDLFDRNVGSCILRPEVTQGSYPVSGEYILLNVIDSQHANSTVYSGVVTNRNGVGSDDPSNNNSTALRNIQQTFEDGFVQFISVFPGHYAQRISTS